MNTDTVPSAAPDEAPTIPSERASEPVFPIDRKLAAEARLYAVPYKPYLEMTPRERSVVKMNWAAKLRREAKRRGIDPDEFLAMDEEQRQAAREQYPEQNIPQLPASKKPKKQMAAARTRTVDEVAEQRLLADEAKPRRQVAAVVDDGLSRAEPRGHDAAHVHSPGDEVPATEADPRMRDNATLGEVVPLDNDDIVGWKQPRTLQDVYARWTVGDGQHYIHVERIDPRVWQQIPCAGTLQAIQEPISDERFHQSYGGRLYLLTVYGPDPKGRTDPNTGLPIIKAKTEPFKYTVPVYPPNLTALPGFRKNQQGDPTMNPFAAAAFPGSGLPATPADATMHKTTMDFVQGALKRSEDELGHLRSQLSHATSPSGDVIKVLGDTSKAAIEAAEKAAALREKGLLEQLTQQREETKALTAKLEKLTEAPRGNTVQDTVSLINATQPGKTAEEEVVRQRQSHAEAMEALKIRAADEIKRERDRHDDEIKRERQRYTDMESATNKRHTDAEAAWKTKIDDYERDARKRLDDLRQEIAVVKKDEREAADRVKKDEREAADRRVAETVARFEDRIKDMKSQQERELRMQGENHTTRIDTTKGTLEMQLANAKERIEQLKEDLDKAREEASEAQDPLEIIQKAEKQAEAMGFEKHDKHGPKTAMERFVATAGMGLSKAFETMDQWVPKAVAAARGPEGQQMPPGMQPRALPPGQVPPGFQPQQQAQQRGPSRRAVAWATAQSVPVAGQYPTMPPEAPPIAATPAPAAPPVQVAPPMPATAQPESQAAQPSVPGPTNGHAATTKLGRVFTDDVVQAFRAEVERAINSGLPSEVFAQRFVGMYPEPSQMLTSLHSPDDLIEVVRGLPDAGDSPVLRRDGRKWVEELWDNVKKQLAAVAAQQQPTAQA